MFGLLPALLFAWFMLQLGGLVMGNFGDYFQISVLQQAPASSLIIPLALATAYAARQGIGVLARANGVLLPLTVIMVALIICLLLPQMTKENVLPLIDVDGRSLLATAHSAGTFPFSETVIFLMVLPHLEPGKGSARRPIIWGIALGGLLLTGVALSSIAVLGESIRNSTFPTFAATRLVEAGELFTRMELLSASSLLTMGFVKISLLTYGAATALAQALRLESHQPLVLPVTAIMVILALSGFRHGFAENVIFAQQTWPYYAPLFTTALPLTLWLAAVISRQPREGKK